MIKRHGSLLQRIFFLCFSLVFVWLIAVTLTGRRLLVDFSGGVLAVGCIVCFAVGAGLWFLVGRIRVSNPVRTEKMFLLLCFAAYFALQLYLGWLFRCRYSNSWDFTVIADNAVQYLETGAVDAEYFSSFPNNIFLYYVYLGLFSLCRLFGCVDYNIAGIVFGALSVDVACLLVYLTVRRVTGSRRTAAFSLAGCFGCLPFLAYSGIFYSDTLGMPYPILTLYLWLLAKDALRDGITRRGVVLCILLGLSCGVGSLFKMSCAIVLIAACIDALLCLPVRRAVLGIGMCLVLFFAVYSGGMSVMQSGAPIEMREEAYVPKLHWVMMGLKGLGNYNNDDYEYTLSFPPEERDAAVKEELTRRLESMGLRGFWEHLKIKLAFTWGDGTYYSSIKLDRSRVAASWLDPWLLYHSPKLAPYAYLCQFHLLCMLTGLVAAAALGVVRRRFGGLLFPCLLAVFGIFLFLSIWETRSRYLLHFVPVFLCALPSVLPAFPRRTSTGTASQEQLTSPECQCLSQPARLE